MNSILTSVKKLLGIAEECTDFDADIIMYINMALFALAQMGVGPGGKMQANCVPSRRRTLYVVAFIILRDLTRFFNSFCRF